MRGRHLSDGQKGMKTWFYTDHREKLQAEHLMCNECFILIPQPAVSDQLHKDTPAAGHSVFGTPASPGKALARKRMGKRGCCALSNPKHVPANIRSQKEKLCWKKLVEDKRGDGSNCKSCCQSHR